MKEVLVRKVPADDGALVTYAPVSAVAALLAMSSTALTRWAQSGAVRSLTSRKRIQGNSVFVAVIDAAVIRAMPQKERNARGLVLTTEEVRAYGRAKTLEYQSATMPADQHQEPWADKDVELLIELVNAKTHHRDIGIKLGRTYAAVNDMIERLVIAGDIDVVIDHEDDWRENLRGILSAVELEQLEEVAA